LPGTDQIPIAAKSNHPTNPAEKTKERSGRLGGGNYDEHRLNWLMKPESPAVIRDEILGLDALQTRQIKSDLVHCYSIVHADTAA